MEIDVYSFGVVAYQVLTGLLSTDLGKEKREEKKPGLFNMFSPASACTKFSREAVLKQDGDKTQWRPSCVFVGDLKGDRSKLLPLVTECWSSSPQKRPDFPEISERIQTMYNRCFPSNEHHGRV